MSAAALSGEQTRTAFAFACAQVPWETAVPVLARHFSVVYAEEEPYPDDLSPGVIFGRRVAEADRIGSYGHPEGLRGDLRISTLRDSAGWVYLDPGGGGLFAVTDPLRALASATGLPVFEVMSQETLWQGQKHHAASLRIRAPDRPARRVELGWEYDPPRGGKPMRRRNVFTQNGPVHPAEDLAAYENKRITDRLSEDTLRALIGRIGARVPTIDVRDRALIFTVLDADTPLEPVDTLLDRLSR